MSEETTEGTITRVDYAPGGTTVTLRIELADAILTGTLPREMVGDGPPETLVGKKVPVTRDMLRDLQGGQMDVNLAYDYALPPQDPADAADRLGRRTGV